MTRCTRVLFILLLVAGTAPAQSPMFRSGVFLHHSTGGCIWGPNGSATSVPDEIVAYNSAHSLSDSFAVSLTEEGWPATPWDNEWYRWHRLFDGEDADADITPYFASDRIIIIKSCFPSSSIWSDGEPADTLDPTTKSITNYKWHWRSFIRVMASHPENFFVVWTNAPLVPAATNDDEARRSDAFCRWAKDTLAAGLDPVFGAFPPNVYVFDFFHKLTDSNGRMRLIYAASTGDSHPNAAATALVAPQFVNEVFNASITYEESFLTPPSVPALSMPPDNAVNLPVTVTFTWNAVPAAMTYHLIVAEDPECSSIVAEDSLLTDRHAQFTMPADSTRFYWKVRANNSAGAGDWSPVWLFMTAAAAPHILQVRARWNLLSLPGTCSDAATTTLFPTAVSPAFRYGDGGVYLTEDTLEPGIGYWMKFPYEQIVSLDVEPVSAETISVVKGWNIIGAIGTPVAVGDVISIPGGLSISSFFGYDGGYVAADSLRPGRAYWVNVPADCMLVLADGSGKVPRGTRIHIDDAILRRTTGSAEMVK